MITAANADLWRQFKRYSADFPTLGPSLDLSRRNFPDDYLDPVKTPVQKAFVAMTELEKGGIIHQDEKLMVINASPDRMNMMLAQIASDSKRTQTVVIFKSGGAERTRTGMPEARATSERAGLKSGVPAVGMTSQINRLGK